MFCLNFLAPDGFELFQERVSAVVLNTEVVCHPPVRGFFPTSNKSIYVILSGQSFIQEQRVPREQVQGGNGLPRGL